MKDIQWLKPTRPVTDEELAGLVGQWLAALAPWLEGAQPSPRVRVVRSHAAAAALAAEVQRTREAKYAEGIRIAGALRAVEREERAVPASTSVDCAAVRASRVADDAARAGADLAARTRQDDERAAEVYAAADADEAAIGAAHSAAGGLAQAIIRDGDGVSRPNAELRDLLLMRRWYAEPRQVLLAAARWEIWAVPGANPWAPIVEILRLGCVPIGILEGEYVIYAPTMAEELAFGNLPTRGDGQ